MELRDWVTSIVLIGVLLAFLIVLAQSRRECENPGAYAACVEFEKFWLQSDLAKRPMTRRFPAPWKVEQIPGGYVVRDATGQSLAYVYARESKAQAETAKVLTMDEARRIANNIANLAALLKR
jgi:hypothetical protein